MVINHTQQWLTPHEFVKLVCQLAKEKNSVELSKLRKEKHSLNLCRDFFRESAVMLLAKEGDVRSADFLIINFDASISDAVEGYAEGGHIKQVNKLIEDGAWRHRAVRGYKNNISDYLTGSKLLYLLSLTDDEYLRNSIANIASTKAKEQFVSLNKASLLKKAKKINELINSNNLSFEQALNYLSSGHRIFNESTQAWVREGQQLVNRGQIPHEVHSLITAFVTGLPEKENHIFMDVMQQRIEKELNPPGYFATFFTKNKLDMENEIGGVNYPPCNLM